MVVITEVLVHFNFSLVCIYKINFNFSPFCIYKIHNHSIVGNLYYTKYQDNFFRFQSEIWVIGIARYP